MVNQLNAWYTYFCLGITRRNAVSQSFKKRKKRNVSIKETNKELNNVKKFNKI